MDAIVTVKMKVSEVDILRMALEVFERHEIEAGKDMNIDPALRRGHNGRALRANELRKQLAS